MPKLLENYYNHLDIKSKLSGFIFNRPKNYSKPWKKIKDSTLSVKVYTIDVEKLDKGEDPIVCESVQEIYNEDFYLEIIKNKKLEKLKKLWSIAHENESNADFVKWLFNEPELVNSLKLIQEKAFNRGDSIKKAFK